MSKTVNHTADEHGVKAAMVETLRAIIEAEGLSQVQAAERLGVNQPKVSGVLSGRAAVSVEQLMRFIIRLGYDVTIDVTNSPRSRPAGRVRIRAPGA